MPARNWALASLAAVLLAALTTVWRPDAPQAAETAAAAPRFRRPRALLLLDDGRTLLTANRRSGSISVIDTAAGRVAAEHAIGRRLADLETLPGGRHLLAVDEAAHELILLERRGTNLTVAQRLPVARYPVSVCPTADGRRSFVASLWSRRLTIVDVQRDEAGGLRLVTRQTIDLPYAPREQILVAGDTRLIVADAFGGRLGIFDAGSGELVLQRELPAHNIRGLATTSDGRKLLLSHQILNDLAETTQNDVHWGVLMSNVLRWVVLEHLMTPGAEPLKDSHVHLTGDTNTAGGDPAEVAVTAADRAVVALGGVGEVGFGGESDFSLTRLPVGRRPTAVALAPDGQTAYVADTFGDAVAVVDLGGGKVTGRIALGAMPEPTLEDRGEMLFYDARLSLDGWFSCNSCHTDGHTNGLMNDNLGDNSFGAPKRVLSLLGVADTAPWAWNGSMTDLGAQIRKSVRTTMQGRAPEEDDVRALAAFLKTLRPPPSLSAARGVQDPAATERGRAVFQQLGCAECHAGETYTSAGQFDVGLTDQRGQKEFNPPSLRGVSQRGPFFHDNSAATLTEVFTRHGHQLRGDLSDEQLADLIAWLETL